MERSTNYNFYLPSTNTDDIADIDKISDNFRIIDEDIHGDIEGKQDKFCTVTKGQGTVGITVDESWFGIGATGAAITMGSHGVSVITTNSGVFNVNTARISDVGTPTANTDAANKKYVDDAIDELKGLVKVKDWESVQKIVRSGEAAKYFKVGDQLQCNHATYGTLTWDIIGIDQDTPSDPQFTHSLTVCLHNGLGSSSTDQMQADEREALFSFPDGLLAGTYKFRVTEKLWASTDVGKTFQFTLPNAVPAGGQVVLQVAYATSFANSKIRVYASPTSSSHTAELTLVEGSTGTSLGDVDYSVHIGGLNADESVNVNSNSTYRALFGNGRYSKSAIRQWLNANTAAGSVWTPQTDFARPPQWSASRNGFLYGMDDDFIAAVGSVTKKTALTGTDGGGTETTTEKVFLLSRTEVYGGDEVVGGDGSAYAYYRDNSDLQTAGTGNDANRIKYLGQTAAGWYLRTAANSVSSLYKSIDANGGVYFGTYASSASAIVPACCIV